jgi:hypothetical protein
MGASLRAGTFVGAQDLIQFLVVWRLFGHLIFPSHTQFNSDFQKPAHASFIPAAPHSEWSSSGTIILLL